MDREEVGREEGAEWGNRDGGKKEWKRQAEGRKE